MANKTISINTIILKILKNESFNHFTISHLRDAFIKESNEKLDSNQARKLIYKQILKLLKLKVLRKTGIKGSHNATYSKNNLFYKTEFLETVRIEHTLPAHSKYQETYRLEKIQKKLEKSIQEYQVEMISAIGESEEYMRLFEEFPTIEKQLKEKYLIARERSSKILGKIAALNNIRNTFKNSTA